MENLECQVVNRIHHGEHLATVQHEVCNLLTKRRASLICIYHLNVISSVLSNAVHFQFYYTCKYTEVLCASN